MTYSPHFIENKRREAWALGVQHRELLLAEYMTTFGLHERPLLKDIVDDVIEEVQGARLLEGVLPLDTYGQTEMVNGSPEITINNRIAKIPGVKDAAGIAYITRWHESFHVAHDLAIGPKAPGISQLAFPGLEQSAPNLIVCRPHAIEGPSNLGNEFMAENAGIAAAIAYSDLERCEEFQEFLRMVARGGDLGGTGLYLLYKAGEFIGANPSALIGYLEKRGNYSLVQQDGKTRLFANPQMDIRLD
ncbi:MAG: hypothetical protein O2913_10675 [Chloroflexi bacterium]|nr:hypothetical protein [Chloroflexota bacterium]